MMDLKAEDCEEISLERGLNYIYLQILIHVQCQCNINVLASTLKNAGLFF